MIHDVSGATSQGFTMLFSDQWSTESYLEPVTIFLVEFGLILHAQSSISGPIISFI
jgi:hypothetical protein